MTLPAIVRLLLVALCAGCVAPAHAYYREVPGAETVEDRWLEEPHTVSVSAAWSDVGAEQVTLGVIAHRSGKRERVRTWTVEHQLAFSEHSYLGAMFDVGPDYAADVGAGIDLYGHGVCEPASDSGAALIVIAAPFVAAGLIDALSLAVTVPYAAARVGLAGGRDETRVERTQETVWLEEPVAEFTLVSDDGALVLHFDSRGADQVRFDREWLEGRALGAFRVECDAGSARVGDPALGAPPPGPASGTAVAAR